MLRHITTPLILSSLLLSAAIFGFFYAWICSTMWGLDATDPRIAIQAMQAMNGSVRNAVFAPAFFGTPVLLAITALVLWRQQFAVSAYYFTASATIYFFFGLILTMSVNVPMNEALAIQHVPDNISDAEKIWAEYSPEWQFWNRIRTVASGLSFLLAAYGSLKLKR
ncbi:anthrone oxygenase family protein [Cochlodiniinecator piscidefendens]|uniref:anthrone oxygenase family protein n=1 Tax=Cochlodiniinecator piscidefendens TaxID=2715756 RepID=UPI00140D2F0F|nr:anthrone oxygenase family protein [Cochlodiniinecator piscidefendens]